jgi:hypothetical protein
MRRCALVVIVNLVAILGGAGLAPAAQARPIARQQYFLGLVDGASGAPTIDVACPGPASQGAPLPRQSVAVSFLAPPPELPAQVGFTGAAHRVAAALIYTLGDVSVVAPLGTLRFYNVGRAIPTTLRVPCSGSGEVVFSPVNGGSGARAATVTVTFVNIAVDPPASPSSGDGAATGP